jgi:hypothetical protein
MGTRNLTKVIDANGVIKVAQYGQWDGYPSGQGVNAIVHAYNHRAIEKGLSRVVFATQTEADSLTVGIDSNAEDFSTMYPNISRDTCADILGVVAWSIGEVVLIDDSDFEKDTLFCEGVYTIDFQKRKFISWFDDHTVEYDLDNLPYQNEYVDRWETILNAEAESLRA